MTDKQPEALRWAAILEHQASYDGKTDYKHKAAAELRRLHEVNAELVGALRRMKLEKGFVCDCGIEDATWDLIEAVQEKADDSH